MPQRHPQQHRPTRRRRARWRSTGTGVGQQGQQTPPASTAGWCSDPGRSTGPKLSSRPRVPPLPTPPRPRPTGRGAEGLLVKHTGVEIEHAPAPKLATRRSHSVRATARGNWRKPKRWAGLLLLRVVSKPLPTGLPVLLTRCSWGCGSPANGQRPSSTCRIDGLHPADRTLRPAAGWSQDPAAIRHRSVCRTRHCSMTQSPRPRLTMLRTLPAAGTLGSP